MLENNSVGRLKNKFYLFAIPLFTVRLHDGNDFIVIVPLLKVLTFLPSLQNVAAPRPDGVGLITRRCGPEW